MAMGASPFADGLLGAGLALVVLGLAACAVMSLFEQPVPSQSGLREVTGKLTRAITAVSGWKAETYAHVELETPHGRVVGGRVPHLCFLWKDCAMPPRIGRLLPGDTVTIALTEPVRFHGDHRYVWEFRQGETTLVSFEDVSESNAAQRRRYLELFGSVSLAGLVMLTMAGIIRIVSRFRQRS